MRLQDTLVLANEGRFAEALRALNGATVTTAERQRADILRIELLERLGDYGRARHLAERALRSRLLAPAYQADCRAALGRIELDEGRFDRGIELFVKALELARQANDARRVCWVQLRLLVAQCGKLSAQASAPWISQCRLEVVKLGDPLTSAALHVFVGEVAAKHGARQTARRHTVLGLKLLNYTPNVWLTALAENTLVGLALIEGDFETGMKHAIAASAASELSGAAAVKRACLGNLGNLFVLEGSWEKARDFYRRAADELQTDGEYCKGLAESTARLNLFEGHIEAANQCLDSVDAAMRSESDLTLYTHRHAQLTRAVVMQHEGRYEDALRQTALAYELAERSGDRLLRNLCDLTRAEILCLQGRYSELITLVDSLRTSVATLPVELLAHYERVLGSAVAGSREASGIAHFGRAARVYDGLRHRPGQMQLQRASASLGVSLPIAQRLSPPDPAQASHAARAVQDVLALLLHVGRPELLATDLVEVLAATGCIARVSAAARHDDGRVEHLAAHAIPVPDDGTAPLQSRTICIGTSRNRSIELTYEPMRNVDGIATVNAVSSLLEVVRDLDAARAEREERLGLWPVEELQDADDDAVIQGAMREVMRLVRKVAPTSASVLITGESGTGKEIVARALHRYSNRPGRPFVPFNCTAVPRDLLESHLFGYRRGAFTGAERDHPGVVRIAKDGTLFLDEVGELTLDLQPKLLRFLESGEINPLGEAEPVQVATRIIAATNANLERLVQEGRFRADLFYRLRVVPLSIPPLRERRDEIPFLARHFVQKAATEYEKGQIQLDDEALELLGLYHWPGNVRELSNELRRVVALADNDTRITADALSPDIRRGRHGQADVARDGRGLRHETLNAALARMERDMIAAALKTSSGRLDDTARTLGISRKGLYLKRLRFGL